MASPAGGLKATSRRDRAAGERDPQTCSTGGTWLNLSPCLYHGVISAAACSKSKNTRRSENGRGEKFAKPQPCFKQRGRSGDAVGSTSTCCCMRNCTVWFTSKQKSPVSVLQPRLLQTNHLVEVFSVLQAVPTVRFTERESCELRLPSLCRMAARWKVVTGINFSF